MIEIWDRWSWWKRVAMGCGLLVVSAPMSPVRAEARSPLMEAALTFETVEQVAPPAPRFEPWFVAAPAPELLEPPALENPIDAMSRSVLEFLSRHRYTPTPTVTADRALDAILVGLTWYR